MQISRMPYYFHCQKYPRTAAQNYLHTSLTPTIQIVTTTEFASTGDPPSVK